MPGISALKVSPQEITQIKPPHSDPPKNYVEETLPEQWFFVRYIVLISSALFLFGLVGLAYVYFLMPATSGMTTLEFQLKQKASAEQAWFITVNSNLTTIQSACEYTDSCRTGIDKPSCPAKCSREQYRLAAISRKLADLYEVMGRHPDCLQRLVGEGLYDAREGYEGIRRLVTSIAGADKPETHPQLHRLEALLKTAANRCTGQK